ncbi:hypothetical protein BDV93DRAFT_425270, partial [Ceratobasidium sp. AG-I]
EDREHSFSAFAARMIEQRILPAYREYLQLLRKSEDGDHVARDWETKTSNENQKQDKK